VTTAAYKYVKRNRPESR